MAPTRKINSFVVLAVILSVAAASWSFPAAAFAATQKQTVKETPRHKAQKKNKASVRVRHLSAARTPIENQKTSPAINNYGGNPAAVAYPGWVSYWTYPTGTWNVPAGAGLPPAQPYAPGTQPQPSAGVAAQSPGSVAQPQAIGNSGTYCYSACVPYWQAPASSWGVAAGAGRSPAPTYGQLAQPQAGSVQPQPNAGAVTYCYNAYIPYWTGPVCSWSVPAQ